MYLCDKKKWKIYLIKMLNIHSYYIHIIVNLQVIGDCLDRVLGFFKSLEDARMTLIGLEI